ncbi:efflux RND transporter permease subunit [Lujinxingia vulgaris]|uniref:Efflux RND transporter permease subunit n=1 Tax=Lujinxingia vulgaris TaxID=2600176 RepID=A0A5C6X7T3_9DELT|nr:efflux RND transporter permease subunit [Lujinxingia vulgaris]TXD35800.1 efflux RND transporter permease subunit [Lujinxingia vulgaris]
MNLPKFAVGRPVMTTMVFLGLMILGAVSFTRLQVDLLPEIDFPSISVMTTYEGAGPEEIETLITRPIEEAIGTVEGIDSIESFSAEGRSRVALRFVWGTNLDTALNDVRATIERVKAGLPEDADDPVIFKFNLGSFPIMQLALSGEMTEPQLRQLAELQLAPRLERVEGVASVDVRGGLKRQIQVVLNTERLRAFGLSPTSVVDALRAENRNLPAGNIERFDQSLLVRVLGEAGEPEDLQTLIVGSRSDGDGASVPIYLRDVAQVLDTFEDPSNIVRVNRSPSLRLSVTNQSGTNTVEVAERVRAEIKRINRDYEGRAVFTVATDTSEYIEDSISNVQDSVLIGAALAVLVLLFFLRSIRSTLIIAVGIPISIIGIFTLMYYFDITLNLISFGGVALGVGLLVDNAIVILENIFRRLEEGDAPEFAAVEGSREVATAIVASTITTLVVFVPVVFLTGFASIFFGQMAFVVSFALICSLAVAMTLIPMLASRFLKRGESMEGGEKGTIGRFLDALEQTYGNLADWCLGHPKITLATVIAMFAGVMMLSPFVGTELLPEDDMSEVRVSLDLPVGTRIEVTERAIQKLEAVIPQEVPELVLMQTIVGTPGFYSTAGGETGQIELQLVKPDQRERSSNEIAADLSRKLKDMIPGGDVRVRAGGGLWILRVLQGGGERLEVQVRGYDLETADKLAAEVAEIMTSVDGITGANVSRKPGGKEVRLVPDREKLGAMGVRPSDVARQVQTYIQGTRASVLRTDGDEFDVIVRLPREERLGVEALLDAPVVIPGVGTALLGDIVSVEEVEGPLTIERENQGRVVDVRAFLSGERDLGTITADLRERINAMEVPDEFSVLVQGETEEQEDTFAGLMVGILLAVVLVYMVMAAQFESFLQPLYIMFSIPLAGIGVVLMLLATGTTFNLQSFMGCIVLTGIVVNNAIVLVDYVNLMRRERGMAVAEAVALSARRRLRPILMTTATTVLALIPVALGLGEGGDTQAPLARAVIGGLFVSAAISLVVIPVIYNQVEGWRERRAQRR